MNTKTLKQCAILTFTLVGLGAQSTNPTASDATTQAVAAARSFLASLNDAQRSKASNDYNSPKKAGWHNLPTTMAPRGGVTFGELDEAQRKLAMAVVQSVLSPYGYQKMLDIIAADDYFGKNMGAGFPTGPDSCLLAIYGTPSLTEPWMIQLNAHHLGLNVTIVGKNNVMAPSLTGAYPNIYPKNGATFHVLGTESNRAGRLMLSLNPQQQLQATITSVMGDFILGPGHDGQVVQPEGLKASGMTADQKNMLIDVAAAWVDILNETAASERMAEVRKNINDTYFAWSGEPTAGDHAYFRIQGPTIWVEYAAQNSGLGGGNGGRGGGRGASGGGGRGPGGGSGGRGRGQGVGPQAGAPRGPEGPGRGPDGNILPRDPNHIHTVYRDFTNDYASRFAGK